MASHFSCTKLRWSHNRGGRRRKFHKSIKLSNKDHNSHATSLLENLNYSFSALRVRKIFLTGWEIDGAEKTGKPKSGELFTSAEFHLDEFLHPFGSWSYTTGWQILMNVSGSLMSATGVMGKLRGPRPVLGGIRWGFLRVTPAKRLFGTY